MSAQGWVACETCGGKGSYAVQSSRGPLETDDLPCPDCADGLVPSEAVVEAAALPIHNKSPKCYESFSNEDDACTCRRKARTALIAARRYEEGQT